jgi:hypothetical protein
VALGLTVGGSRALAQRPDAAPEYEIKAAYLLNFTRYVEWPPRAFTAAGATFTICVLGDDPFGRTLDEAVRGREAQGRPIQVARLGSHASLDGCHIAFLSDGAGALLERESADGAPVLLVGDGKDFAASGGVIGFVVEEQTVRFQINVDAARARGIRISSRVMTLAVQVYGGEEGS